jgi:VWFA-related protein
MIAKSSLKPASSSKRACWWTPVACALVALVVLPRVGPSMRAQDAATTIAVDVKVVTLPVTVRDKHGKIVRDLIKDDFTLQEDGRPQTIRYFSQEANLPLTLGLLVDTSRSQTNVLDAERNASRSFLDQMLVQEKDKAFLIHFDREVELLQDLTSSREKLQAALELLKTPSDRERSNDPNDSDSRSGSGSGSHHGGGTQLYDAVFLASNELMKKQQGRKALIILSDGVDRGSKTYLESAIESAQRADTVVYSIYFADSHHEDRNGGQRRGSGTGRGGGGWPGGGGGWPGGGGGYPGGGGGRGGPGGGQRHPEEPRTDGKKILERISRETGGRFFEVSKKESVGEIYTSIVEELRTQYSMGYTPDKDSAGSGYHHVTLAVKRKDLTVQTREGYYADR